jgi:hypothetical protein
LLIVCVLKPPHDIPAFDGAVGTIEALLKSAKPDVVEPQEPAERLSGKKGTGCVIIPFPTLNP